MGFLTTTAKVWYPALTDKMQLHTLFSTMASSLETGLGARMSKQEETASMVANLPAQQNFVVGTGQSVNFSINSMGYNDGMTLTGGKVQITKAGLYFFSTNCLGAVGGTSGVGFMQTQIRKNTTQIFNNGITAMVYNGGSVIATTSGSVVMKCVPGDVIDVFVAFYNTPANPYLSVGTNGTYNILSASLLKAL